MTTARKSTISRVQFFSTHSLEDLAIEGEFHLDGDISEPVIDKGAHFAIEGFPNWGMTTLVKGEKEKHEIGYFHLHGEEKVYNPPISLEEEGTLIPCYECKVALKRVPY